MQHSDVRTNGYPLRHDLTPVPVRIEELKPLGQQTRRHATAQIGKLAASLQEFGFVLPIVVDAKRRVGIRLGAGRSRPAARALPSDAPWLDEYLSELLAFPYGRHDDQVDSTSQFLNWAATRAMVNDSDMGCSSVSKDPFGY
ncbi:hypothetical protein ABIB90_007540 [Bradyrhizobium sp. JR4.1]|uniref:ParB N-terminal domain-containing protein n=1 Tax=unclassified Bradyrhizobium TaxID=2631580 RepID=UPI0033993450